MKTLSTTLFVSAIGLALVLASPAEAAKKSKNKNRFGGLTCRSPASAAAQRMDGLHSGGVRAGPLYNGPDYLGDDPDPSIRAYLIKDMTRRYRRLLLDRACLILRPRCAQLPAACEGRAASC